MLEGLVGALLVIVLGSAWAIVNELKSYKSFYEDNSKQLLQEVYNIRDQVIEEISIKESKRNEFVSNLLLNMDKQTSVIEKIVIDNRQEVSELNEKLFQVKVCQSTQNFEPMMRASLSRTLKENKKIKESCTELPQPDSEPMVESDSFGGI